MERRALPSEKVARAGQGQGTLLVLGTASGQPWTGGEAEALPAMSHVFSRQESTTPSFLS